MIGDTGSGCALGLASTLWLCHAASAMELPDAREMRTALHQRVRERVDCIAWYDFADPEASGLTYVSSGDELRVLPGRWPERKAARLFHGSLRGEAVKIPATGFTLCCWLRVNGFDERTSNAHRVVMSVGSGWYDGWRLLVRPGEGGTGVVSFIVGQSEGGRTVNCGGCFATGKWQHLAVTWDHRTLAIWIDGVLRSEATVALPYTAPTKQSVLGIGACGSKGLGALDFEIADLAFFSTVLPQQLLKLLHEPSTAYVRALAKALAAAAQVEPDQEQECRRRLTPFLKLPDTPETTVARAVRAIAGLRIADSFRREGRVEEARRAYAAVANGTDAPVHCRARAMLAAGDLHRDARRYEAARREYEKTREFFTGKHEAFRADAIERLRDIETLADGAPFRSERQRRIDRISHATAWFFVAPDGDDRGPGTLDRPFRTLERARDALRERRKREALPSGGVAIALKGGVYRLEERSLTLGSQDSGAANAPIIYHALSGERPVIRGGRAIRGFTPLSDPAAMRRIPKPAHKHVVQADLKAQGVEHFGKLRSRGPRSYVKEHNCPAHLELFFRGRPMSLARWPNDTPKLSGRFATVEAGSQKTERNHGRTVLANPDVFSYRKPRQDAWAKEPDGWMFGYWQWMWDGTYQKIARVDSGKRLIHIDWQLTPWRFKPRVLVKGAPYQGINLLCELDSPGEWYLDRASGLLFFCPPSAPLGGEPPPSGPPTPQDKGEAVVSVLEEPLVKLDQVSHVVFRGLTFEVGRKHGIVVNHGENVLLAGCVVRNMGVDGIIVHGGRNHEIIGCDVAHVGGNGLLIKGGDVEQLAPSGHVVENCHVHDAARWNRSGAKCGIEIGEAGWGRLRGVGCRVSHCLIHDLPMYGLRFHGNDNILEYSEIHDVGHETGDTGAFNMYGNGSTRALLELGNVLRYNYWHDLPSDETFKGLYHVARRGIYIDSFNSNITVYGNIFQRCDVKRGAVFFGACDNRVENCIFHRCHTPVYLSDRTSLYGKINKPPTFAIDTYLAKAAANSIWARRYPRLTTFSPQMTDTSVFLAGNVVARNIAVDCERFCAGSDRTIGLARIEWNWTDGNPGLRDPDRGDFTLTPESPALVAAAFQPLPFKQIGLYNDELRATWPVEHKSGVYQSAHHVPDRKPLSAMPVCRAMPCTAEIIVDGRLDATEWGHQDKADAIVLERTPQGKPSKAIPSYVWARRDAENLFIAVLSELNPGERPRPRQNEQASWWRAADIVEVMFEGDPAMASSWWPAAKGHGPVFYLVGDCAGNYESIAVGDLPKSRAAGLGAAVSYAAISEPGRWTAEWRIPLKAICLNPKTTAACCFNVGVHKPGTRAAEEDEKVTYGQQWVKWAAVPSSRAWEVWNAAVLRLRGM